jgi:hypothetical protein
VAERPLRHERAGPAAGERQEMQRALADAPPSAGRGRLVDAVGRERDDARDGVEGYEDGRQDLTSAGTAPASAPVRA